MKLVIASQNQSKTKEIKNILADLDITILSASEVGISEEPIEDGQTFEENAIKKAKFVHQKAKHNKNWVLADDAGLCIKYLDNAPGIYSARWAGEQATGQQIIDFTLDKLKPAAPNQRQAFFQITVALISPAGQSQTFNQKLKGTITAKALGTPRTKLPYDQIFIPEGYNKTFAQMTDEQKNKISHRFLVLQQVKKFLKIK